MEKLLERVHGSSGSTNGIIVDFSRVLSGCTKGNAVPYTLGAGQGSKGASMYQIKYMGKDCVEISASASVLVDAYTKMLVADTVVSGDIHMRLHRGRALRARTQCLL